MRNSVLSACLAALTLFAATAVTQAQTNPPNPMLQNPMMPAPVQPASPMNPMSLSPMQPMGTAPADDVERDPDFDNLPVGAGMEETFYLCTACHSSQTFQQMRLTDARWEYLWDWMIKEQGMPDYGPEDRAIILAYLQTHFSSQR